MSVKRYKIGFRVDIDGQLNHLWDSRDMVMAHEFDDLAATLKNTAEQLQTFRGNGRLDEPSGQPSWTELDEVRLWEARTALEAI